MDNILTEIDRYHEDNLDAWFTLNEAGQENFLKDVAAFADKHPEDIIYYVKNLELKTFSGVCIIYKALSLHAVNWNRFLFIEIQRIVESVQSGKYETSLLSILREIDLSQLYLEDKDLYTGIMNYLTDKLGRKNKEEFNLALLDLIGYYLMYFDKNADVREATDWKNQLENLRWNAAQKKVRRKAAGVLLNNFDSSSLKISEKLPSKQQMFLNALFIIGVFLQIFVIEIFQKTIIEFSSLFYIYFGVGSIFLLILYHKLSDIHVNGFIVQWLYCIVTFGGIAVFLFLFINDKLAPGDREPESRNFTIIKKSEIPEQFQKTSKRPQTVYIVYDGLNKGFDFNFPESHKVYNAKQLKLTTQKGFFGYDVVRELELSE